MLDLTRDQGKQKNKPHFLVYIFLRSIKIDLGSSETHSFIYLPIPVNHSQSLVITNN